MSEADDPPPLDYAGPQMNPPRRRWVLWLLLGIVLTLLAIAAILPTLGRAREPAKRIMCASNFRQIGQAILLYANNHQGQYPDSFATLLLNEDISSAIFICPDSDDTPADGPTTQAAAANLSVAGHCSYNYLGSSLNTATVPGNAVIVYEPLSNHDKDGMNVLFGDGHVDFISPAAAGVLISKVAAKAFPVTTPAR